MELYKLTAHELRDLLRKKEVSSVEITKSILDRISEIDSQVQSYITVTGDEAVKRAQEIDDKISAGEQLSDLAGIPMALKDNICTENVLTTCASKMLYNFVPPYNATVTKKLNEAGAVLVGKLNMDEFAMGSSTENSHFKKTKNPYDLDRVPGGSSGGSAAAVSADEAIFALGSDTGGSIRQPAAFCGVVGMKPTYGTVSRFGLVAFASSLDQIGPLTKDVTDCALVLNAITGHDPMDSTSVNIDYPDYTKALVNDVKGLKIGVPKEYIGEGINAEVRDSVLKSIEVLKDLGAEYEEFSLPITEYALPAYYLISSAEASSNLARYDGIKYGYRAEKFKDLLDLYKQTRSEGFGKEVKRRIMLGTYALSSGYYDAYYKKAQQVRTLIMKSFDDAFNKYDVIITPTTPTTAFKFGEKSEDPLEMYAADICTVSVNIAGLPGLVIPCGFDSQGLPVGMQLIGKAFDEPTLLRAAYTFEQNTEYHKVRPKL
ncbi:MAG: glutamyl-tRNA(Gln) and/or aspartyl-tRNA(Asn) amidotransferase, subunit [Clostridia bacterium]|uniref:Asp-tRNA(Asn)/Glu-tRNA(Gln) amidotransferase subunit GatA n=1 Tax=Petroclostridium xylanilyticum TaxID=1792311 RepID=UPI000B98E048|nr:Asp-tRNA(Asn)/Glu-tRNA(Gln) amidotransferase subunit GatA [Petroclostridium xylanilyticum]MBZ4646780.1 glutamyl-tRNA(Gln) and/or aspartyl-tRNA(Asn) amidotransferase, subunit [Clostridia bacterium]